ncbi:hypothetical protein Tco_0978234 [Tanacetum coccineum]|uniref:Uncharacterized protein n=1 Tax=Tanacetum coccineum TaxID=301880 RepID=A0ABQ5ENH0_9ASTR
MGLTDSSRIDNSPDCRDMMANLFTPANNEFLNDGVSDAFVHADFVYAHDSCKEMKATYKECKKGVGKLKSVYDDNVSAYDQLKEDYDGSLNCEKGLSERVKELKGENKELEGLNAKQADRIKQLKEELKNSEVDTHQLRVDREKYAVECGNGEMVRRRIINEYLPTFIRRLHQSVEHKRSLGEFFSLAVGKGFIDGVSIGRKREDIQAILAATPNVDPASSAAFMGEYEKLFDKRYPYVDKVARAYMLDQYGLQNVMPDETGPTPDQGPRATPKASYA